MPPPGEFAAELRTSRNTLHQSDLSKPEMHHNDAPSRALFGMTRNTLHYKVTESQSERVTGPAIENIDFFVIKMVQKSTENRPNIDPKSSQNPEKSTPKCPRAHGVPSLPGLLGAKTVLELSWRRLGGILEPSWSRPGSVFGVILGLLGAVLGAS